MSSNIKNSHIIKSISFKEKARDSFKKEKNMSFSNWLNAKFLADKAHYRGEINLINPELLKYDKELSIAKKKEKDGEKTYDSYEDFQKDNVETGAVTAEESIPYSSKYYEESISDSQTQLSTLHNERISNDLGLFAYASARVKSYGGFWKSLFSGKVIDYIKDSFALSKLKDNIKIEHDFTDEQLNKYKEIINGEKVDYSKIKNIDEDGDIRNYTQQELDDIEKAKQAKNEPKEINYDELNKSTSSKNVGFSEAKQVENSDIVIKIQ